MLLKPKTPETMDPIQNKKAAGQIMAVASCCLLDLDKRMAAIEDIIEKSYEKTAFDRGYNEGMKQMNDDWVKAYGGDMSIARNINGGKAMSADE
jgi:hypothetical protein